MSNKVYEMAVPTALGSDVVLCLPGSTGEDSGGFDD
jgi:hypothetical protein